MLSKRRSSWPYAQQKPNTFQSSGLVFTWQTQRALFSPDCVFILQPDFYLVYSRSSGMAECERDNRERRRWKWEEEMLKIKTRELDLLVNSQEAGNH